VATSHTVPAETPAEHALRFPQLTAAQVSQLAAFSAPRHVHAREILFDQGSADHGVFIVLSGSIEIVGVANEAETVLSVLGPGEFTGEVTQLSGRPSLVLCRACATSELLEVARSSLMHVMQTDALLGDVFLSAFLLRPASANLPRAQRPSLHVPRRGCRRRCPGCVGSILGSRDRHTRADLPWPTRPPGPIPIRLGWEDVWRWMPSDSSRRGRTSRPVGRYGGLLFCWKPAFPESSRSETFGPVARSALPRR